MRCLKASLAQSLPWHDCLHTPDLISFSTKAFFEYMRFSTDGFQLREMVGSQT